MKALSVLLSLSLIANAGLVGALILRAPGVEPGSTAAPAKTPAYSPAKTPIGDEALRAALTAGDVTAFEAAGVSTETARQLVAGRALARATEKLRALQARASADGRWWRNRPATAAEREEQAQVQRELSEALAAALGVDLFARGRDEAGLAFLPTEKRQALSRILQDYEELMARYSAGGIPLPSDREKLKLLRAERERDIAALLSPQELADYELRTSPSAQSLRARFGDGIASEEDFRTLFALQKTFDEKYPREAMTGRIAADVLQQRLAAERQLQDDMRAALGDEKYAALRRAADGDLRNIEALAERLNLPADTTDRVAATRASYAAESQRIQNNSTLTPPERRSQLQDLAARARAELAQTLGPEAADAYAQRTAWLSMLQAGVAYSTDPKDAPDAGLSGQAVYPVMPAGAGPGMGVTRQVVNLSTAPLNAGAPPATGGAFFFNATPPAPGGDTMQFSVVGSAAGVIVAPPGNTPSPASPVNPTPAHKADPAR